MPGRIGCPGKWPANRGLSAGTLIRTRSSLSIVLQPVDPAAGAYLLALQTEPAAEPGREPPPPRVGLDRLVAVRPETPDLEADRLLPGVHQPELRDSRRGVEGWKTVEVFLLGAVADDLDDHVRRAFHLDVAVGLPAGGGDVLQPAAVEGVPEDHDDVGLDREVGPRAGDPGAV